MTTANKLTLFRVLLVPVFLGLLYSGIPGAGFWALGVFILASLTDFADGYIARHYHQVTNFGKFMDPLADKMLVLSAMCYFVECRMIPGWMLAVVLLREFAVSGLRMIAVEQGKVIAACFSGKVKTFSTMVCLCIMLFLFGRGMTDPWADPLRILCIVVMLGTTVYSGAEYFVRNGAAFKDHRA